MASDLIWKVHGQVNSRNLDVPFHRTQFEILKNDSFIDKCLEVFFEESSDKILVYIFPSC